MRDSTECRERLATLMAGLNAQLAALEGLLVHEYTLLQSRDADNLELAGTARQQCIGEILRIEDERRALCRAAGRGEDPAGLHSLLAWCDPTGLLMPSIEEYRQRTRRCREQNDRNGILVNARLNVPEGGTQGARSYGSGGDTNGYGHTLTTRA
jgi:flagellar biosynthesis/type III secretory pathway chaperone